MAKIPDHATCVFKGIVFDVYQWEQELYDGTKATFESLKRPNTVVVIPLQGDQVFYAYQEQPGKPPAYTLFGGRADPDETPLETAKRELQEETGLVSEEWQEIRQVRARGKLDWTVYFFVARNCRKVTEQKLDGGEKIAIHQMPLEKFLKDIVTNPNFGEYELTQEIMSAFNSVAFTKLQSDIFGN